MTAAPYTIGLAPPAEQDVKHLRPFDQRKVVEGMETHLSWEPTKVSRSRIKLMIQPFWCQYRLRVEDFRVYYDVNEENRTVTVLRILEKGQTETTREQDHETD